MHGRRDQETLEKIGDSEIYSTGHYLVTVEQITRIFESYPPDDAGKMDDIEAKEVVTEDLDGE